MYIAQLTRAVRFAGSCRRNNLTAGTCKAIICAAMMAFLHVRTLFAGSAGRYGCFYRFSDDLRGNLSIAFMPQTRCCLGYLLIFTCLHNSFAKQKPAVYTALHVV